jgi:hypothetical protein
MRIYSGCWTAWRSWPPTSPAGRQPVPLAPSQPARPNRQGGRHNRDSTLGFRWKPDLLPSFAGFSGTTGKLGKIEKILLFGTMRNRQLIPDATKLFAFTFTALELVLGLAGTAAGRLMSSENRGKRRFRWEDYRRAMNPGDQSPHKFVVRVVPQRFPKRGGPWRRTARGAIGK